jgi:serine protease Do
VKAHGAAADAGVKPGDVIEDLNGVPVRSMPDMMAALYSLPPDQSIVLNVPRGGHLWAARASLASAA